MRLRAGIVGVAAVALLVGCGEQTPAVVAQADPSVPGNAGEEYMALHAALGKPLLDRVFEASGNAGPELAQELDANKDLIDRLAYATRMDECDWGVPEDLNFDAPLPHMSKARDLARTLNVDARRLVAGGDAESASRRIAGLVRLAHHAAEDGGGTVSEWLVGNAVLKLAAESAIYGAADLDAHQRGRVLAEFQTLDLDDTFGFEAKLARMRQQMDDAGHTLSNEDKMRDALATVRDEVRRAITALEDGS